MISSTSSRTCSYPALSVLSLDCAGGDLVSAAIFAPVPEDWGEDYCVDESSYVLMRRSSWREVCVLQIREGGSGVFRCSDHQQHYDLGERTLLWRQRSFVSAPRRTLSA